MGEDALIEDRVEDGRRKVRQRQLRGKEAREEGEPAAADLTIAVRQRLGQSGATASRRIV